MFNYYRDSGRHPSVSDPLDFGLVRGSAVRLTLRQIA